MLVGQVLSCMADNAPVTHQQEVRANEDYHGEVEFPEFYSILSTDS